MRRIYTFSSESFHQCFDYVKIKSHEAAAPCQTIVEFPPNIAFTYNLSKRRRLNARITDRLKSDSEPRRVPVRKSVIEAPCHLCSGFQGEPAFCHLVSFISVFLYWGVVVFLRAKSSGWSPLLSTTSVFRKIGSSNGRARDRGSMSLDTIQRFRTGGIQSA